MTLALSSRRVIASVSQPGEQAPTNARRRVAGRLARHVQLAQQGNTRALIHGIYARVANEPDVRTEVALQFTIRPGLDPLRDRRLVEDYALATVSRRRVFEAIGRDGLTRELTAAEAKMAPLAERLERAVHERERERQATRTTAAGTDPLAAYRPTRRPSSEAAD